MLRDEDRWTKEGQTHSGSKVLPHLREEFLKNLQEYRKPLFAILNQI